MLCLSQVLEYYPSPWDEWLNIGNLPSGRALHAVISIGPEQFDCMAGESFCQNALNWFSQSNPAQSAPNCLLLTASLVSLLLDPRFSRMMEPLVMMICNIFELGDTNIQVGYPRKQEFHIRYNKTDHNGGKQGSSSVNVMFMCSIVCASVYLER